MKVQCDVCGKEEASVFCPADEAALCKGCDNQVHDANKLADKHTRFSLLYPSFKESPRCDICQERRAFLFCQEDRAILCRECDIPIHKANELTQKHKRFLLTGLKLSASLSSSSSGPAPSSSMDSEIKSSVSNQLSSPSSTDDDVIIPLSTPTTSRADDYRCVNQLESSIMPTSSISEYLMETLPGWRVDDFLDPSCSPHGFCKTCDHELPLLDQGFGSDLYPLLGDSAIWVPQAPSQSSHILQNHPPPTGMKSEEVLMTLGRKRSEIGFKVPYISPSVKKSRHFW